MPRTTQSRRNQPPPDNLEQLPPPWCRKWIGKAYVKPYGCFFLIADILCEEFSVRPPMLQDYDLSEETLRAHAAAIARGLRERFREIDTSKELLLPGDVIAIGTKDRMYHIGILVAKNWMLHSHEGADSCLERLSSSKWRGRIAGYFRSVYL